jgi:hypothetical protein
VATMLDTVKTLLRISASTTAYDTEVQALIDEAKADLALTGVLSAKVDESDELIARAIATYCKANFGWQNADAERLQRSYDLLRAHLTLSVDYAACAVTFAVTSGEAAVEGATIHFDDKEKVTGSAGNVVFYVNPENQLAYTVSADGYVTVADKIDITGDVTIDVALTEG